MPTNKQSRDNQRAIADDVRTLNAVTLCDEAYLGCQQVFKKVLVLLILVGLRQDEQRSDVISVSHSIWILPHGTRFTSSCTFLSLTFMHLTTQPHSPAVCFSHPLSEFPLSLSKALLALFLLSHPFSLVSSFSLCPRTLWSTAPTLAAMAVSMLAWIMSSSERWRVELGRIERVGQSDNGRCTRSQKARFRNLIF